MVDDIGFGASTLSPLSLDDLSLPTSSAQPASLLRTRPTAVEIDQLRYVARILTPDPTAAPLDKYRKPAGTPMNLPIAQTAVEANAKKAKKQAAQRGSATQARRAAYREASRKESKAAKEADDDVDMQPAESKHKSASSSSSRAARDAEHDDGDQYASLLEALPRECEMQEAAPQTLNASVVGRRVLFKFNDPAGWGCGTISAYHKKQYQGTYNFDVDYTSGDTYPHQLKLDTYSTLDNAQPGSWCLLIEPS